MQKTSNWMAAGTAESLAKTMGLWPALAILVFACIHTKQITVVICVGEKGEGEINVTKFEQIPGVTCFTAVAGSKWEGTSLKASLSDYLGKQRSDATCEEMEKYVDRWDIANVQSESELSRLEILIEEVKLNGNCLLRDFLEMDDVRALDSLLEQEVQLIVNIAPPIMYDKELVDEYTKIRKSVCEAVDAVCAMASLGAPNVSFCKYVSEWQVE